MPYEVKTRGRTRYDSEGNYWGYFTSGQSPPCVCVNCPHVDKSCPVGAIDCYPRKAPKCRSGYTSICRAKAPWCSCRQTGNFPPPLVQ